MVMWTTIASSIPTPIAIKVLMAASSAQPPRGFLPWFPPKCTGSQG